MYLKSLILEDTRPVHNDLLARILVPGSRLLIRQPLALHFAGPELVRCAVARAFRHTRILLSRDELDHAPDHGPEERHVRNVDGDRGFAEVPEGVDDVVEVLGEEGKGFGQNAGDDLSKLANLSRSAGCEEKMEMYNEKTHAEDENHGNFLLC